jgi:hypothetical protein
MRRIFFPTYCFSILFLGLFLISSTCVSQLHEQSNQILQNITGEDGPKTGTNSIYRDAGSWVGFRVGNQANGGALDERWAFSGFYEWRSPEAFSLVIDYQIWRQRFESWNGVENTSRLVTLGIMDLGFKFRYNFDRLSVSVRGGVGTGISLAPVSFHYGVAVEYMLDRNFSISLSQKRYAFPEIDHFFLIGIVARIP